jgi:short-subunit dehydrogenase
MKGKTVVITGGTSGIGEIAAEQLAQMGARIVLIARDNHVGRRHWRSFAKGHPASPTRSITPIWRASQR